MRVRVKQGWDLASESVIAFFTAYWMRVDCQLCCVPHIGIPTAWHRCILDDLEPGSHTYHRVPIFTFTLCSSVVLFGHVIPAGPEANHGLIVPWLSFYCVASVISLFVLALKLSFFVKQLRERRAGLNLLDGEQSADLTKFAKHHKLLVKTQQRLYMIYASVAVGITENVPIGIMQGELASVLPRSLCAFLPGCLSSLYKHDSCAWPLSLSMLCLHTLACA